MDSNVKDINTLMAKATELMRTAELQIKTLNNAKSISVHLSKELPEFTKVLEELLQVGAEDAELVPVVKKYMEYAKLINNDESKAAVEKLSAYPSFVDIVLDL